MRFLSTLVIGTALMLPAMALPAMAQTTTTTKPTRHHTPRHMAGNPRATPEDQGPFTPEANAAFNGGGAVLVGRPGEPAPPPSAVLSMPPGQPLPPPPAPRY